MTDALSHLSGFGEIFLAWLGFGAILAVVLTYVLIEMGVVTWRVWNKEKFWSALMKYGDNRKFKEPLIDISIDPTNSEPSPITVANPTDTAEPAMQESEAIRKEKNKIIEVLDSSLKVTMANGGTPSTQIAFEVVRRAIDRATPNRFASEKPDEIREILLGMLKQYKNANANANNQDAADALGIALANSTVPLP